MTNGSPSARSPRSFLPPRQRGCGSRSRWSSSESRRRTGPFRGWSGSRRRARSSLPSRLRRRTGRSGARRRHRGPTGYADLRLPDPVLGGHRAGPGAPRPTRLRASATASSGRYSSRAGSCQRRFYDSPWGTRHPRLQLLTVADLLSGRTIDYPRTSGGDVTLHRAHRPTRPQVRRLITGRRDRLSKSPPIRHPLRTREVRRDGSG